MLEIAEWIELHEATGVLTSFDAALRSPSERFLVHQIIEGRQHYSSCLHTWLISNSSMAPPSSPPTQHINPALTLCQYVSYVRNHSDSASWRALPLVLPPVLSSPCPGKTVCSTSLKMSYIYSSQILCRVKGNRNEEAAKSTTIQVLQSTGP